MLAEDDRGQARTLVAAPAGGLGYRVIKSLADIVVCLLSLVVLVPLLAVLCLAIVVDSPGWPMYRQWRAGLGNRRFRIWKLRTMVPNADRLGPPLTQDNDPRITRAGRVIRRWSLDELPQVFNVLTGQMSLVGPRPELCTIVETYTPEQMEVLLVKPGLTGWSQVNGRDDLDIPTKLAMDREYVYSRSTLLDLKILARTIPYVLTGDGIKR